jgi:SAM-dependent methyltransferase
MQPSAKCIWKRIVSEMLWSDVVLIAILLLCIVTAVTMLTNLWVRVPYVPTSPKVARRMIELAGIRGNETVYDLGCGDGRILIAAKKQHPHIDAVGYELSLGVWLIAKLRVLFSRLSIPIHMKNYCAADLSDANVVFLYLFPEVMPKLMEKLNRELKPGTRVISHGFPFKEKEHVHMERVPLPAWHIMRPPKQEGPRVFVYEW